MDNELEQVAREIEAEFTKKAEDDAEGSGVIGDSKAKLGVILSIIKAQKTEAEYRQAIILSEFIDPEEADRVSAAITEAKLLGLSLDPILDWAAARCAVNKSAGSRSRAQLGIEGVTHQSLDIRQWLRDKNGKEKPNNTGSVT